MASSSGRGWVQLLNAPALQRCLAGRNATVELMSPCRSRLRSLDVRMQARHALEIITPAQELLMATQIFVNLPVKQLDRSIEFFTRLGYRFNPQFTDANATCMIVTEGIFVMLLVEDFFKTFTHKELCDAQRSTEVILALSADSRAQVEELVAKAAAAGATLPFAPKDHGFMYQHGFQDLDGHLWEVFYMDPAAVPHP
jgi:uncharacterized protein